MSPKSLRGRTTAHGIGRAHPTPIALNPAAWKGASVVGDDYRLYFSDGIDWKGIPFTGEAVQFTEAVTYTVGAGGDFASLNAAFVFLSKFAQTYRSDWQTSYLGLGGISVILRILSGTVLAEQVGFFGVNFSWVAIEAEDPVVQVDPTALITRTINADNEHAFMFGIESKFPAINGIVFDLAAGVVPPDPEVAPYTPKAVCFSARLSSSLAVSGVDPGTGFVAAGATGWTRGAVVGNGSYFATFGCTFDDNTEYGIRVQNNSQGRSIAVTCARNGTSGISCDAGSRIYVGGNSASAPGITTSYRNTDGVDSAADISCTGGSFVSIASGVLGGLSIPANTSQALGIILRPDAPAVVHTGILKPTSYTVATKPAAASYNGHLIHVSDGDTGSPCLAVSNGTDWLRIALGAAVAAS